MQQLLLSIFASILSLALWFLGIIAPLSALAVVLAQNDAPTGRATAEVLRMRHPDIVLVRCRHVA